MKKSLAGLTAVLLLAACDTKDKTPLAGERVSLFAVEAHVPTDVSGSAHAKTWPQPIANHDWNQAGYNATHDIPHLALSENLQQAFMVSIGQGSGDDVRLIPNLCVNDDRIFALDARSQLSCIDFKTGQTIWTKEAMAQESSSEVMGGGLCIDNKKIFVTNSLGDVIAYDFAGQELWRQNVKTPLRGAPTAKDGRVFVPTVNNELFALDAQSGKILWNHLGVPEVTGLLGTSSPAVAENLVIVPFSSGEVYALRADTGSVVWHDTFAAAVNVESMASLTHIRARPVVAHGKVYILSHGRRLVALDLKTGTKAWQQDIGGMRTPAIVGGHLYLISNTGEIFCLNAHDGKIIWSELLPQPPESKERVFWSGPVAAGGHLIVYGSNGEVAFLSPDHGKRVRSLKVEAPLFLSPVVADNTLLALTDNAEVVAWR